MKGKWTHFEKDRGVEEHAGGVGKNYGANNRSPLEPILREVGRPYSQNCMGGQKADLNDTDITPEQMLAIVTIEHAVADLAYLRAWVKPSSLRPEDAETIFSAEPWLMSDSRREPWGFATLCDHLGMPHERVRKWAVELADEYAEVMLGKA